MKELGEIAALSHYSLIGQIFGLLSVIERTGAAVRHSVPDIFPLWPSTEEREIPFAESLSEEILNLLPRVLDKCMEH